MTDRLPVVIIPDGGDSISLKSTLSDHYFNIIPMDLEVDAETPKIYEKILVTTALEKCRDLYPDRPCLLIKDTSITRYKAEEIKKFASVEIEDDLLYLCRWNDSCNLYRDPIQIGGNELVITYKPYGFQAIIFSVRARDLILSKDFEYNNFLGFILPQLVYSNKLTARTYIDNIYEYDIVNHARDFLDYVKFNRCSETKLESNSNISSSTYFYATAIVFFVAIVGYSVFRSNSDDRNKNQS